MKAIQSSEITPESVYLNRRQFMKGMGVLALGAALAACAPETDLAESPTGEASMEPTQGKPTVEALPQAQGTADEMGDPLTPFEAVTNYNNFYEFTTNKEAVARQSRDFVYTPWTVEVGGLVQRPKSYSFDDLLKFGEEERIYRLRCVEGWSMVIPWLGFPLGKLIQDVEPTSDAKYVRFETLYDPKQLPGQNDPWYQWPYIEGLRLDEAMNDLAILSTGLYGERLLPQNGAPIRLVVPWKYGFKSIKSIVKIDLVAEMPVSLWMNAAPNEYGFYANVNPDVPHPRWSQSSERRIGELSRRPTLKFNGYEEEVTSLYAGMDLKKNY